MSDTTKSPRRLQRTMPTHCYHNIDSLIARIEEARPLYNAIVGRQKTAAENASQSTAADQAAIRMEEWTDTTDEPVHVLGLLEREGLIATIKVGNRYYSRPAE